MNRRSLVLALVAIGLVVAATAAAVGLYRSASLGATALLAKATYCSNAGLA